MEIQIHRGLHQIGGCITEISTDSSRIFIDMGQNLPGVGKSSTQDEDHELVNKLFSNDSHKETAVFYTHAHEDHVGLFWHIPKVIPQFISAGGLELLLAKYDLIKKGHELSIGEASADMSYIDTEKNESERKLHEIIVTDEYKINLLKSFHTWEKTKRYAIPQSIEIGNIRITPFFNCHSIYDSYMFLIEADGKRIWHTGDYREHGYMGKALIPTLKKYATDIDMLITEGTMLNRNDECIHEREVSRRMTNVMNAFKYIVVLASATDIERLASIKEAAKNVHKQLYICSGYMKKTMFIFTRREGVTSKGLFKFSPRYVCLDDNNIPLMRNKGFVLIVGANNLFSVKKLCKSLDQSEVIFVYSSWDGYYKDPEQVKLNPQYKNFRESFQNVVDIHTSGHADRKTLKKVIETVNPKEGIICIHKDEKSSLESLGLSIELKNKILTSKFIVICQMSIAFIV